jgi:hypothetical protein
MRVRRWTLSFWTFSAVTPGAYGVRYLFVIYGFPIAETENFKGDFLGGPLKSTTWNLFDSAPILPADFGPPTPGRGFEPIDLMPF